MSLLSLLPACGGSAPKEVRTGATGSGQSLRTHIAVDWPDLATPPGVVGGGEGDSALVVGIERYDFVPPVLGAVANARDWYTYFTGALGVPATKIKLVPQDRATREEMLAGLEWAAKQAAPGARVWFVFIGHGAPTAGDGLLVGVDARQTATGLESRSLRHGEALATLNRSSARPVIVLDACFSGQTSGGESVVPGLQPLRLADLPDAGRAVVMTAAASDQYAGPLPGSRTARPAFSYLALG
ncbi:MAG TPA: caspase family protein, partial [Polyangia bacterium]|nr:caspase family protein [Polyangia bacterium]